MIGQETATAYPLGAVLVHPQRGVAVVEGSETRSVDDHVRTYVVMRTPDKRLKVLAPEDSMREIGFRKPMSTRKARDVLRALSGEPEQLPPWGNNEYRDLVGRLDSGNPFLLAGILRDLSAKRQRRGLPMTEGRILRRAARILASEIAVSMAIDIRMARTKIAQKLPDTDVSFLYGDALHER